MGKAGGVVSGAVKLENKAADVAKSGKADKVHGNTLNNKPAEGYTLRDKKTNEVKNMVKQQEVRTGMEQEIKNDTQRKN